MDLYYKMHYIKYLNKSSFKVLMILISFRYIVKLMYSCILKNKN